MKLLTPIDRDHLLTLHRKERDGRVRDRHKVVLLTDDGWSVDQVAKAVFIKPSTVKTHLKEYEQSKKLKPANGGSTSKLTIAQTKELLSHLESVTYVKSADIRQYIKETYGVSYTLSGLVDWLKSHGFSYKGYKGLPAKADKEKQAAFIERYRKLEKEIPEGEEIVFIDSSHPTQSTKLGYGWIKKGTEKQIKTGASRSRINLTGGINIKTKQVLTCSYDTINSESTIDFLNQLSASYPNSSKLHVVLDQAGYHKSKEVTDWIEGSKIVLHYLPPYSPNLNPIERLWKIMNEYVRNNRYFSTAKEFRESIEEFFSETIPKIPDVLASRINSNFQILPDTS